MGLGLLDWMVKEGLTMRLALDDKRSQPRGEGGQGGQVEGTASSKTQWWGWAACNEGQNKGHYLEQGNPGEVIGSDDGEESRGQISCGGFGLKFSWKPLESFLTRERYDLIHGLERSLRLPDIEWVTMKKNYSRKLFDISFDTWIWINYFSWTYIGK